MEYPELAARTGRFTRGAPRAVTVSSDGDRVVFLRSGGPEDPADQLWVFDVPSGTERLVADPADLLATTAAALPPEEAALRERLRLTAAGIGSYATDARGRMAVFTLAGRLFRADLIDGGVTGLATAGPVIDPRPDPTGARIAYVTGGALRVLDADGTDTTLADERGVTWGMAEFIAAEEFYRYRGYWWAPDGRSILAARVDEARVPRWHLHDPADPAGAPRTVAYPHAGADNAEVSMHLLDLEGGWVDVHWDRETYPYVTNVSWSEGHVPLLTVLRRLQQHGLILAVDPRTGETQVHAELADPRWVDPVPGTPVHLSDGRVLVGGEIAHDGYDARCLFADGSLLTPPEVYVRRVCGRIPLTSAPPVTRSRARPGDRLEEGSEGEPSEQHLYQVDTHTGCALPHLRRLTHEPGWHHGVPGGDTIAIGTANLDEPGTTWVVWRSGERVGQLRSLAATPPYAPRPVLERVTDRAVPAAVVYPRGHVGGRRLPVLVDGYGGPGHQEVTATRNRWLARQWWADQGFAVVTVDNRGTPGVAPSFEKVIHRRMADVVLGDQVDALHALAGKHPDLDMGRVAIRGWSFGGWLAALAVLRRPDVFHVGVAGAPVTDWLLYDTAYTERYLGLPESPAGSARSGGGAAGPDPGGDAGGADPADESNLGGDVYARHNLVALAGERDGAAGPDRPLLLVHGMVDDNVVAAHTLRLSAALLATGRPHAVIPLPGATHMAAGGLAERLLHVELDFIRQALHR